MTTRVELNPVYVLHHRPYRNSSLILELISKQHGRIAAVARSARGPKSRYKGNLQLFSPLLVSWSGRSELMTLNQMEQNGLPYPLEGQALLCAFYLNELLLRLVPHEDPYPNIFADYENALTALIKTQEITSILRRFEKRLLEHLGYGISFSEVADDAFYQWLPDRGFLKTHPLKLQEQVFSGSSLLALKEERWDNPEDIIAAKRLMRLVLGRHLGNKPLKSRELF